MDGENEQRKQNYELIRKKKGTKKQVPAGVGIYLGICIGAGVAFSFRNPLFGIAIGTVFAIALEIAFKHGRNKGDA